MLGKKILKVSPPSVQCFDPEDTGKLVVIVTASEMTREYLIKQKILPDHISVQENSEYSDVNQRCINPISTGLFCLVVALGGGCFPPPSITPLSLKLDCSNFVQSYFEVG